MMGPFSLILLSVSKSGHKIENPFHALNKSISYSIHLASSVFAQKSDYVQYLGLCGIDIDLLPGSFHQSTAYSKNSNLIYFMLSTSNSYFPAFELASSHCFYVDKQGK